MLSTSQLLAQSRARQLLMIEDKGQREKALQALPVQAQKQVWDFMQQLKAATPTRLAHVSG